MKYFFVYVFLYRIFFVYVFYIRNIFVYIFLSFGSPGHRRGEWYSPGLHLVLLAVAVENGILPDFIRFSTEGLKPSHGE
jgi:hypothetical protein